MTAIEHLAAAARGDFDTDHDETAKPDRIISRGWIAWMLFCTLMGLIVGWVANDRLTASVGGITTVVKDQSRHPMEVAR